MKKYIITIFIIALTCCKDRYAEYKFYNDLNLKNDSMVDASIYKRQMEAIKVSDYDLLSRLTKESVNELEKRNIRDKQLHDEFFPK